MEVLVCIVTLSLANESRLFQTIFQCAAPQHAPSHGTSFLSVYNAQVAPRHTRSPDKAGTLKLGIQLASDFPVGLEKEDNSFCGLTEIHGRGRAEVRREN